MTYELQGRAAHPLTDLFESADFPLADLIPTDALAQVFDGLYYTEARSYPSGTSSVFDIHLAFESELALEPAGDEGPAIVFGETEAGWTVLELNTVIGPASSVSLVDVPISLRIPRDVLRDVETDGPAMLTMTSTFTLSSDGGFFVETDDTLTLAESEVAGSGVTVSAAGINWNFERGGTLPEAVAAGLTGEFIGLGFQDVVVKLPPDFTGFPDFSADYCCIGTGGLSGRFHATYSPEFSSATKRYTGPGAGELFGIPFALFDVQIEFKQTALTKSLISGKLLLPFFDEYCDVEININLDGSLNVRLAAADGLITLTKPGLLKLTLESIQFEVVDGIFRTKLAGEVTPLIGAGQGVEWPSFHVNELSIDSKGNIHLDGGWLNLREKYIVKFHGFEIEVSKLGFGNTEDGGKWIGFTGGVKLVAAMPAGASVEGLRITWYPDGHIDTTLKGVHVEFEVPNTLKFAGEVSYDSAHQQFHGAVKLDLIALKMQVDATAVFGMKDGQPYLAIYLAAEFPAGIPLFATGLGVYGMAGLFAMNMEPNRAPSQAWYSLPPATGDWYHATPEVGVTNLQKWTAKPGSMAFGAGVTLGTVADNGHTFSGKMLLAIVFPGPILLLQGSASLLQERTAVDKDANFRALAVLDGRAGTLQLGLDAQYRYDKDNGNLIDIHGAAEGFFNFNDPSAWHLNVGLQEPRDRRLSARLFKLFDAYAYVALDAQQLAMGAWIGFKQQWQFGPLAVALEAWIDGNARVSWKPAHFYGDLSLHGSAKLSVFGFGAGLTVDARIAADVFDPFHVLGQFNVAIDLPWPLSDIAVNVKLEWGPQPTPPPLPLPLKEIAIEHFKASTSWPLSRTVDHPILVPKYDNNNDGFIDSKTGNTIPDEQAIIPIVPLDSRPHVTFARNINDDALVGVNAQRVVPEFERIGDPVRNQGPVRIRYGLEEIALEKLSGGHWTPVARKGKTPNTPSTLPTLFGSWAPVPQMPGGGGRNVGQTKLWLWSKTPFEYTRRTGRSWDEWFTDEYGGYPCQTIAGAGWDFEDIAPGELPKHWTHPDPPGLSIDSGMLSIVELSRPSHGLAHALGVTGHASGDAYFALERPTNLIRIMITDSRFYRVSDFVASDGKEGYFGGVLGGTPDRPYIEFRGVDMKEVHYYSEVFLPVQLAKGLGAAIGGAYVPSLHQLIFVEFGSGKLSAIDLLTNEYSVLGTGYRTPEDVVVTADGTVAYVTERVGTLLRVDLTGNADRANAAVVSQGMTAPQQIVLDEEGGKAYVVEYVRLGSSGRLLSIDLDGPTAGNQTVLASGFDQAVGLLMTEDLSTAYVSEQGSNGRILKINLAAGSREVAAENIPAIFFLRWANVAQDAILTVQRDPINFLIRIDLKNPAKPERIMDYLPFRPSSVTILPDGRYVVCSDSELTIFADTLLIPKICDVGGNLLVRHFEDELARWSQAGEVLEPHTKYRLKVVTNIRAFGERELARYSEDKTIEEYAYFQTDGPPGVAQLTAPATTNTGSAAPGSYVSPLDDLSRYVRKTMPRLAKPTPETPVAARPFYRAYDLGIEFDENYVDLMYRLGRRDLSLHLHDTNGAIRDAEGGRLVLANQWGRAEQVTLSDREERWLAVLGESGCSLVNIDSIVKNNTFNGPHEAHVLSPSTLCEARLIPALLHDDFGGYTINAGADGPSGSFERWQVRDDARSASHWKINSDGNTPPDFELRQTVQTASTTLVYKNTSDLPADHSEQPSNWTNYRLTVPLCHKEGQIGIVFRYRDDNKHYRFVMDQAGKRELSLVVDGVATPLATTGFEYVADRKYVISVEAIGSSLRVYQNGKFILGATDSTLNTGSIGVYSSGNSLARFTDIYVHDYRSSAPVVYRYSFLTSSFKNFAQHLNSFDKKTRRATVAPSANVAPILAAAMAPSDAVNDAESRAYDALSAQLPQMPAAPVVQVTRVEQNRNAIAFLLTSPEQLDWRRINLQLLWAPLGKNNYEQMNSRVLRKADGTGLFIVSPAAISSGSLLPAGEYRLAFTYRRNNRAVDPDSDLLSEAGNSASEEVSLDIPWPNIMIKTLKEVVSVSPVYEPAER